MREKRGTRQSESERGTRELEREMRMKVVIEHDGSDEWDPRAGPESGTRAMGDERRLGVKKREGDESKRWVMKERERGVRVG